MKSGYIYRQPSKRQKALNFWQATKTPSPWHVIDQIVIKKGEEVHVKVKKVSRYPKTEEQILKQADAAGCEPDEINPFGKLKFPVLKVAIQYGETQDVVEYVTWSEQAGYQIIFSLRAADITLPAGRKFCPGIDNLGEMKDAKRVHHTDYWLMLQELVRRYGQDCGCEVMYLLKQEMEG